MNIGIVEVNVSEDKMQANIRILEDKEGTVVDFDTIVSTLKQHKVTYGLKEELIKSIAETGEYDEYYTVAEGMKPKHGTDARIDYKKNLEASMKPKLDDKGNVDYLNVDNYISVKQDEVLAVFIPAVKAVTGFDVYGKPVRGREGKNRSLPIGKNVKLLEDKVTMVAKVDGLLQMLGGKISVSPVLAVNSDVDTMTGNIDFIGAVKVYGNVCAGMKIRCKGSVEVNGTVEAAIIEADGDVIINGGIKGMDKAIISAGGNVTSRYIERACVKAKGTITANSIIQGKIETEDKVHVTGSNGSIIGGTITAAKSVVCKKLGSHNYTPTTVEVGMLHMNDEKMKELEMRIQALRVELAKMNTVLNAGINVANDVQRKAMMDQLAAIKPLKEIELVNLEEQYESKKDAMKSNTLASVSAIDYAYPEVTIGINGIRLLLNSEYRSTTFFLHKNEIEIRKCEVLD